MSHIEKLPNLDNVKKRAIQMQEDCQRWDALISVTEDLISQLEEQIHQQPNYIYRLKKAKNFLNLSHNQ